VLFQGKNAHSAILQIFRSKTDSAARLKILLPGSWNLVRRQSCQPQMQAFTVESFKKGSKVKHWDRVGSVEAICARVKCLLIKDLVDLQYARDIGDVRA
jgi:hypothetical protein